MFIVTGYLPHVGFKYHKFSLKLYGSFYKIVVTNQRQV